MIKVGIISGENPIDEFLDATQNVIDFKICCVFANTLDNAKALIKKHQLVAKPVSNFEVLVDEVDAVYVSVIPGSRYEIVKYFLQQQKHVLVDTPMALNYDQVTELCEIANKNNVILLEATRILHSPIVAKLFDVVTQGQPLVANFNATKIDEQLAKTRQGNFLPPFDWINGHGTIHSQLLNPVALSIFLFGKVKSVKAIGLKLPNQASFVDFVLLQHQNDILVNISAAAAFQGLLVNQIVLENEIVGFDNFEKFSEIMRFDKQGIKVLETLVVEKNQDLNSFVFLLRVFVKMILGNKKDLLNYLLGMTCETARVLDLVEKSQTEIGDY